VHARSLPMTELSPGCKTRKQAQVGICTQGRAGGGAEELHGVTKCCIKARVLACVHPLNMILIKRENPAVNGGRCIIATVGPNCCVPHSRGRGGLVEGVLNSFFGWLHFCLHQSSSDFIASILGHLI
jgi:hypothetical protein